ncbi:MAG: NifU family protein [Methylophaga sp.]|nr:NifU family protein [Methylophaga sp.]
MPEIEKIEHTPNPNAKKFVLKEPLTFGSSYSFDNAQQAQDNPLVSALFEIKHITNIFYVYNWLTVTQDGGASWDDLEQKVSAQIESASAADAQVTEAIAAETTDGRSQEQQERFVAINSLIDTKIRPALRGDGGDLKVVSLTENELSIHYQGACGSCPSSIAGTLRGIENLVRTIEPDINVVAV